MSNLFPQHGHGCVLVRVFLHDLRHRHLKVFLSYMNATLTQGEHARLGTYGFTLGTTGIVHLFGYFDEIDSAHQIHATRVNADDFRSGDRYIQTYDIIAIVILAHRKFDRN